MIEKVSGAMAMPVLRKAALMLHWIPDLGLRLTRDGHQPLRVAPWPDGTDDGAMTLGPCEFRQIVVQSLEAERLGLCTMLGAGGEALELRWFSVDRTELGTHGMVWHRWNGNEQLLAFPTLLGPERLDDLIGAADGPGPAGAPVLYSADPGLGASMVYAGFDARDLDQRDQVSAAISRLCGVLGAEETQLTVSSLSGWVSGG